MAGKSGKKGVVTLDGSIKLKVTNWNFNATTDSLDSTGMSDNGFKTKEAGLREGTLSVTCNYDTTAGVTGLPGVEDGDKVSMVLQTDDGPLETITAASALVTNVTRDVPVEGLLTYTIEAETDGEFTVT